MAGQIRGKKELIDKANSRIFLAVIIASLVVSASLVATKILWDQRSFQSRVIKAKTEVNDQLESNYEAATSLKESFEKFDKGDVNAEIVLDALPSKYDYAAISSSFEKLAEDGGYELTSFEGNDESASAVESEAEPSPVPIEFTVKISGTYDAIQSFTKDLEKSIRPFKVVSFSLTKNDEDGMEAEVRLETYYQPKRNLEISTRSIQ